MEAARGPVAHFKLARCIGFQKHLVLYGRGASNDHTWANVALGFAGSNTPMKKAWFWKSKWAGSRKTCFHYPYEARGGVWKSDTAGSGELGGSEGGAKGAGLWRWEVALRVPIKQNLVFLFL